MFVFVWGGGWNDHIIIFMEKIWINLLSWICLECKKEPLTKSSYREKVEVSLHFLTYSRETRFSFSYRKISELIRPNAASDEIDRVSKFDNSLSFGAKQSSQLQKFFALWIFQSFFIKNSNRIYFDFLRFCVGSIKKCIDVFLSMQIQENMFLSVAAHRWGCFWVF